jgi:RNA polymerase sigma-70 factor (ECF subfamily)
VQVKEPMVAVARNWTAVQRTDGSIAFERLFVAEYGRVVGIAQRVLADAHEAEDVAQEVFYTFHRQHPADAAYAPAWLHAAAAHAALNVLRGKRRRFQREMAEAVSAVRLRESAETALDPQGTVEREEQRREVRAVLSRLPDRQASALVLRHSGLSYAEVAAALAMPADQVGTLLRRAESALRKEMTYVARR